MPRAEPLAPRARGVRGLQHRESARIGGGVVVAESERVLACCLRELVDHALDGERVDRVADRAPEAGRDAGGQRYPLGHVSSGRVRQLDRTFHRLRVDRPGRQPAALTQDRLRHVAIGPRLDLLVGVERRRHVHYRARTVLVVREVLLARPGERDQPLHAANVRKPRRSIVTPAGLATRKASAGWVTVAFLSELADCSLDSLICAVNAHIPNF